MAALLLLMGSAARADVMETFNLSGSLNSLPFGSPVSFSGTIDVDFTDNFTGFTMKSLNITLDGRSVFNQALSLSVNPSPGIIAASNSTSDTLTLWFNTPQAGTWTGFNTGQIFFGDVVFGDLTGSLFGADGVITRDPSDPAILTSAAVPELSTWAMMFLGLAGLGFAARGRRALAFLVGTA
jgi:hypothetical protein